MGKIRVKFGFYLEALNSMGLGIYKPEEQFRSAEIITWLEVREGKPAPGKPIGKKVAKEDSLLTIATDKATADWALGNVLPNVQAGTIISLNFESGETWNYHQSEKTPYGTLLLPELGVIEIETSAEGDERAKDGGAKDTPLAKAHKDDKDYYPPPSVPRISPVALRMADEEGISIDELRRFFSDRRAIGRLDVEEYLASRKVAPETHELPSHIPPSAIVSAVPAARHTARQEGIDLAQVHGTGAGGEVTFEDVIKASQEKQTRFPGITLLTPSREWLTVAHKLEEGSRITIACGEVGYDLSKLVEFKAQLEDHKQNYGEDRFNSRVGVRFRLWAPLALALTRVLARDIKTLAENPEKFQGHALFNGYWHIDRDEQTLEPRERKNEKVALYNGVRLGLSYDRKEKPSVSREGVISGQRLRILTLHNAEACGTKEFFAGIDDLFERADKDFALGGGVIKNTALGNWTGYTVIFNNIGAMSHERGFSLFTPGISCILNVGRIKHNDKTILQVFFDHRMIDGGPVTDFLDALFSELTNQVLPKLRRTCFL